jgi:hypothetical protein
MTTARQKLNVAFINGAILIALFIGLTAGSFWIGACSFGVLFALSTYVGDIRLKQPKRK